MFSQYGEERVLNNFFGSKGKGFVVDIGAMDGTTYSNSRYLISNLNWSGLLVEPHPDFFSRLENIYRGNENVTLKNVACFKKNTTVDFHIYSDGIDSCVSTISEDFKKRVINAHGDKFKENPIKVQAVTLDSLMSDCEHVDFLSVDCEGADMDVLQSNNWEENRPSLICIEHSMDESELSNFIESVDYVFYDKTSGNTFFKEK